MNALYVPFYCLCRLLTLFDRWFYRIANWLVFCMRMCVCMLILSSKSIHSAWMTYTFRFFSSVILLLQHLSNRFFIAQEVEWCARGEWTNSISKIVLRIPMFLFPYGFFTSFFFLQSKWLNLCLRSNFIDHAWFPFRLPFLLHSNEVHRNVHNDFIRNIIPVSKKSISDRDFFYKYIEWCLYCL